MGTWSFTFFRLILSSSLYTYIQYLPAFSCECGGLYDCQIKLAKINAFIHISIYCLLCAEWLGRSEDPTKEVDFLPKSQNGVLSPRIWVAPQYLAQCVCPARSRCTEQHFLWHLWPGMVKDLDSLLLFDNFCLWVCEHDEWYHKSWTNIHHVPVFEVETTRLH